MFLPLSHAAKVMSVVVTLTHTCNSKDVVWVCGLCSKCPFLPSALNENVFDVPVESFILHSSRIWKDVALLDVCCKFKLMNREQ